MAEDTRNPTSDEAVSGTWTGSAGSRWSVVDDHPDTGGADALTCSAAGALTHGFSAFSVPAGASSISVLVDYVDLKNGSQAAACAGRLKVGASYFNATTHNPANGVRTARTDTWATNPATSAAWTVDQVNGVGANALAAFGINVTDASPSVAIYSVRVRVTYAVAYTLTAGSGTFTETGIAATLRVARKLTAAAGSFALTGANAGLTYSGGTQSYTLTAAAGSFTLTGQAGTLRAARKLTAATASFALIGNAAGLAYSGGAPPVRRLLTFPFRSS